MENRKLQVETPSAGQMPPMLLKLAPATNLKRRRSRRFAVLK
jgi:hypothetical protein